MKPSINLLIVTDCRHEKKVIIRTRTYTITLILHPQRQLEQPHVHHAHVVLVHVGRLVVVLRHVRALSVHVREEQRALLREKAQAGRVRLGDYVAGHAEVAEGHDRADW
jgi:hypothetical protein